MTAEETTRIAAKFIPKGRSGRRGLPECLVNLMWSDYKRLNSIAKVAALHNRTRQSVFDLFKHRGFKMNARNFKKQIAHNGRFYTPGKEGYLRDTIYRKTPAGSETLLHRLIWTEAHGPIPAGNKVSFKDGNNQNCALDNLFCAPLSEVSRYHYCRLYQDRATWTPAQREEFWRIHKRELARQKAKKNIALGLRSDGKVRRRGVEHKTWDFRYFPRVIREDQKVLRRHVGKFAPSGALGDLFNEIHSSIESNRPRDIYA